MFEQEIYECSHCDDKCKELIEKFLTICLPVKITPHVEVKPVKAECCGKAIITPRRGNCCKGCENGCCEFTIIQKMKVEIPVEFKAKTEIDKPFVDCEFDREDNKDRYEDKYDEIEKDKYDNKDKKHEKDEYDVEAQKHDKEKYDDKCNEYIKNKCDDKCN